MGLARRLGMELVVASGRGGLRLDRGFLHVRRAVPRLHDEATAGPGTSRRGRRVPGRARRGRHPDPRRGGQRRHRAGERVRLRPRAVTPGASSGTRCSSSRSTRASRRSFSHKLAHHSQRHLAEGLGWFALFAIPGAWILMRVTRGRRGLAAWARRRRFLALLVVAICQLATAPIANHISRRLRRRPTWKALQVTRIRPRSGSCSASRRPGSAIPTRPGGCSSWSGRTPRSPTASRWRARLRSDVRQRSGAGPWRRRASSRVRAGIAAADRVTVWALRSHRSGRRRSASHERRDC